MYIKGNSQLRHQNAKFPSSEWRLKWLKENTSEETRQIAHKSMHAILHELNAYTLKIYELRDLAVQMINEGDIQGGLSILNKIGEVE